MSPLYSVNLRKPIYWSYSPLIWIYWHIFKETIVSRTDRHNIWKRMWRVVVVWKRIMAPEAHKFEYLAPRWWNCLGKIRSYGPSGIVMSLEVSFIFPKPSTISNVSCSFSPMFMDQVVSSSYCSSDIPVCLLPYSPVWYGAHGLKASETTNSMKCFFLQVDFSKGN